MDKYNAAINQVATSLKPYLSTNERGKLYSALQDACYQIEGLAYFSQLGIEAEELGDLLIDLIESTCSHIGSEIPLFLDQRWFLLTLKRSRDNREANYKMIEQIPQAVGTIRLYGQIAALSPDQRSKLRATLNAVEQHESPLEPSPDALHQLLQVTDTAIEVFNSLSARRKVQVIELINRLEHEQLNQFDVQYGGIIPPDEPHDA